MLSCAVARACACVLRGVCEYLRLCLCAFQVVRAHVFVSRGMRLCLCAFQVVRAHVSISRCMRLVFGPFEVVCCFCRSYKLVVDYLQCACRSGWTSLRCLPLGSVGPALGPTFAAKAPGAEGAHCSKLTAPGHSHDSRVQIHLYMRTHQSEGVPETDSWLCARRMGIRHWPGEAGFVSNVCMLVCGSGRPRPTCV